MSERIPIGTAQRLWVVDEYEVERGPYAQDGVLTYRTDLQGLFWRTPAASYAANEDGTPKPSSHVYLSEAAALEFCVADLTDEIEDIVTLRDEFRRRLDALNRTITSEPGNADE